MKRSLIILILCLFLIGMFATTYNVQLVGADSGYDASYDIDSSNSSEDDGGLFYLIYLCIEYPPLGIAVIVIIILVCRSNSKKKKEIINKALNSKLELLNPSDYSEDKKLEIHAFNIYKKIEYAWMNFDYDTIRQNTTDEMYNMYLMQLDTLKVKNQKNLMYDIKYLGSSIKERHEENGIETIVINMKVSCYDFIINTTNSNVERGNASKLNYYNYELTFVKTVDNKEIDICPRCGAPLKGNNSSVCDYCKSTIISNNYTLIMSKKKMISQKYSKKE